MVHPWTLRRTYVHLPDGLCCPIFQMLVVRARVHPLRDTGLVLRSRLAACDPAFLVGNGGDDICHLGQMKLARPVLDIRLSRRRCDSGL